MDTKSARRRAEKEIEEAEAFWGELPFYDDIRLYWGLKMSDIEDIKEDIRDIKDNHLTTIYSILGGVNNRVWYIVGTLAILVPLVIAILTVVLISQ